MFETLKRLYQNGALTGQGLTNAVTKGWLTPEQGEEILVG